MNAQERRNEIIRILKSADSAVSATTLAGRLDVSRQIIVGDVALLRARGEDIIATPKGYVSGTSREGLVCRVVCIHKPEDIRTELDIMVDQGCCVEDVIVEHPIYGQLVGQLGLSSRADVDEFVRKVSESDAMALSDLTGGLHIHTLRCPNRKSFERVTDLLSAQGILVENNDNLHDF